jgi:hypothetical protein
MGIIFNGVGIGFLAAIFVSMYAEGFFNFVLPLPIIYGIFAPLFSAIAISLMLVSKKDEKDKLVTWEEKEE